MGSNLERQERLLTQRINCFSMSSDVRQNLIGQSEGLVSLCRALIKLVLSRASDLVPFQVYHGNSLAFMMF